MDKTDMVRAHKSEQERKNEIQEHKYKTIVCTVNNSLQRDAAIRQEEDGKYF
jgi:hypothetical protein